MYTHPYKTLSSGLTTKNPLSIMSYQLLSRRQPPQEGTGVEGEGLGLQNGVHCFWTRALVQFFLELIHMRPGAPERLTLPVFEYALPV